MLRTPGKKEREIKVRDLKGRDGTFDGRSRRGRSPPPKRQLPGASGGGSGVAWYDRPSRRDPEDETSPSPSGRCLDTGVVHVRTLSPSAHHEYARSLPPRSGGRT